MASLLRNKKIYLNFKVMQTFDAGMELFGYEVKALRQKLGSLKGAHITVRGGEAYLLGATIPAYQPANAPDSYDPMRNRRLLLTKKQIGALAGFEGQKGLTIVPISVYSKGPKLKLEIAVVRGKKQHDKRETLKKKDVKRKIERTLKTQ